MENNKSYSSVAIMVISAYVTATLISNISSLQVVSVFGMALDAGTFIYPIIFTIRDLCHVVLGKKATKTLIWCTSGALLFMSFIFWVISLIPIDEAAGGSSAWSQVLTPVWRLTVASIIAGLTAELIDTEIYSWWMNKVTKKHPWSRVLASNAVSIPVDSFIFAFGAFYGLIPLNSVWEIFLGNLWIKAAVTLISIPLIYTVREKDSAGQD